MTVYRPQSGHETYWSQRVANNFPPWHVIRTDATATGHQLLHSWAQFLDEVSTELTYGRRNLYPSVADTLVGWEGYRTTLAQSVEAYRPSRSTNRLRNASLVVNGPAYREAPLWWHLDDNATFYDADAQEGHGSVLMAVPAGETGTMYQDLELALPAGETYVGSIYLKSPRTITDTTGDYQLAVTVTHSNGTSDTSTADLQLGTEGTWVRQYASVVATGQVDRVNFQVQAVNNEAFTTHLRFSAPQFEEGILPGLWGVNGLDTIDQPLRVTVTGPATTATVAPDTGDPVTTTSVPGIELFYKEDYRDMFTDGIPTRAVYSVGDPGASIQHTTGPTLYEFDKSFWDTDFTVSGEYVLLYNRRVASELISSSHILDNYVNHEVEEMPYAHFPDEVSGFSRTLEALTVYRRRIWVLSKETISGTTKRVLKILRWQGIGNRLEVLGDCLVGMDTGSADALAFVEGRHDQMAFSTTDGQDHTITLYYDYFSYEPVRNQVVVRHPYTGSVIEMRDR